MLVLFSFTWTQWIFMSCWFYFLRSFRSISSFPLQLTPCASPAWPSIWPPSWPPCCSLGFLSMLPESTFWNPNLVTCDRIKALTAPHCCRMKFILLAWCSQLFMLWALNLFPALPVTASCPLASEALSCPLVPSPWNGLQLSFHLARGQFLFLLRTQLWHLLLLPHAHFSLSLHYPCCCHCMYCTKLCCLLPPYNMSSMRLGSLIFHPFLLTYSRNSIRVSNELMKITQRSI